MWIILVECRAIIADEVDEVEIHLVVHEEIDDEGRDDAKEQAVMQHFIDEVAVDDD